MSGRRPGGAVLLAVGLLLAACGDDEPEAAETGDAPTTEAPAETTTSSAPASTTTSAVPDAPQQPAIWPAPEIVFTDPVAAATDFLELVIGAGEAGTFRQGDARSGEVDVLFRGEAGDREIVRSTLLLRQLGEQDSWFVIGAVNPNATIAVPASGAEIPRGEPLAVEGVARGFEANVVVSALPAGTAGDPIAQQITSGGALETPEPYSVSLDLSAAEPGQVVTLLVRGGTGMETDPGDFAAIPVVIEV